ncbi:hypothetical protein Acsp05_08670 [Actinokineospora sp. NBRC 105648]|nr:hypothetical protein Acsp05_08670 [Actinokineospora sp. NBRC 105648]
MRVISKRTLALFGALALVLAPSCPANATETTPQAQSTSSGSINLIRSETSSNPKCVGLANNGSTANGTELVLWDCHFGRDQYWYGGANGSLGSFASGYPNGKCIGLADNGSTANGTRLVLWDCHYGLDQRWSFQWDWPTGYYAFKNTPSNKCVGLADNGSTANGTRLVIWDCHHGLDQQWSFS